MLDGRMSLADPCVPQILATQQLALQKLTDLLNNALFDADVIRQGLGMLTSERS
jgi:nuclear pore complex protein Nup54